MRRVARAGATLIAALRGTGDALARAGGGGHGGGGARGGGSLLGFHGGGSGGGGGFFAVLFIALLLYFWYRRSQRGGAGASSEPALRVASRGHERARRGSRPKRCGRRGNGPGDERHGAAIIARRSVRGHVAARRRPHPRTGSGLRARGVPAARGNDFLSGEARHSAKRCGGVATLSERCAYSSRSRAASPHPPRSIDMRLLESLNVRAVHVAERAMRRLRVNAASSLRSRVSGEGA